MWDQQYDDELSDAVNSDEPDSDIEALLYSKVHYEAEEDVGATEAAQAPSLLTGDLASGLASAVAKGKASSKRRERGDAERLKGLEDASAAKRKKKRKLEVIVEEDGGDGSNEDHDASSVDAIDTIVLSSDDELIVFSEESSQDISLNVEGTTETNKSQGDLWRVDVEDRYRINRGFRYHNQFSGVRCRNCNESGHLSKFCPQPKVQVCHLCAEPGHQGYRCPQRICARCYETGHAMVECQQSYCDSCDICQAWGHPSRLCPDLWRRYHLTTEDGPIVRAPFKTRPIEERYCYNCAGQGHFGHQCHMKKRGNPGTPYIISYDDPREPQHHGRQSEGHWQAPPNKQKGGKGSRKRMHSEKASVSTQPRKRPRHNMNHQHQNNDGGYDNKASVSSGGGSKKKKKNKKSKLVRKIEASVASQMRNLQQLHAGKNHQRKKNANNNWRQERPAWDCRGKYGVAAMGRFPPGWRNSAY